MFMRPETFIVFLQITLKEKTAPLFLTDLTFIYPKKTVLNAYEKAGVKEFWLVDTNTKSIEQYILENNQFMLNDVYSLTHDFDWDEMTEEEKAAIVTEFKCSLYDDLIIKLEDVFERIK